MIRHIIEKQFEDGTTRQACWNDAPTGCNYITFMNHESEFLEVGDDGLFVYRMYGDLGEWERVSNPFDVVKLMKNATRRPEGV